MRGSSLTARVLEGIGGGILVDLGMNLARQRSQHQTDRMATNEGGPSL